VPSKAILAPNFFTNNAQQINPRGRCLSGKMENKNPWPSARALHETGGQAEQSSAVRCLGRYFMTYSSRSR